MQATMALTEAVIISGPRKGEIIALPDDQVPEVSEEEVRALNLMLDQLDVRLERFAREVRLTVDALRQREGRG